MSLDSTRLGDFAHQVSAFLASSAKSLPIKTHNRKKVDSRTLFFPGHSPSSNQTYIQSTVLCIHFVGELIYFLNIPSLFNQILLRPLHPINCLSLSLLRSSIQCIRGARSSIGHYVKTPPIVELVRAESQFAVD